MSNSNVKTTGVATALGPNGAVPLRQEVRDLQANFPDQWNLYLLGLAALQNIKEDELTSYYQIAGIHGMPFKAWNGVPGRANFGTFGGYCTHSSVIFLTWHRPYLALYEQVLYLVVQGIANQFPDSTRARYVAAAKDFRIPYYDWTRTASQQTSPFPSAISSPTATVIGTDGVRKEIPNPLYEFKFHPINPAPGDFSEDWTAYQTTVRYPDNSGQSDDDSVAAAISNEFASLRTNVSILLLNYTHYNAFSNNRWQQNEQALQYGSLENVHDNLHDSLGGGGHMSALEVSAFDPVFWLHHCNVDRMWAIWQALHLSSYVEPGRTARDSFTTARGSVENVDSPLKPFWDKSGTTFWTSAGVKDTSTFGYAYPETQSWNFPNAAAYQAALRQEVVRQYGGGNAVRNFFTSRAAVPDVRSFAVTRKAVVQKPANPEVNAAKAGNPNGHEQAPLEATAPVIPQQGASSAKDSVEVDPVPSKFAALQSHYTEWLVNLRTQKHGLHATFRVFVFLGDFDPNPATWAFEPNMVGRFSVLGRGERTACGKCKDDMDEELVVTGCVPLTSALLKEVVEGRLASLSPADVEPYLVRNLHWRVQMFDGSERLRDQVPGLKVSVVSVEVTDGDDGVPVFEGPATVHANITDGRPAGQNHGDQV